MPYKVDYQKRENEIFEVQIKQYDLPTCVTTFFQRVRSSSSKLTYWNVIKDFLKFKFGNVYKVSEQQIKDLTYIDIRNYLDNSVELDTFSNSTINLRFAVLSSFSSHLVGVHIKQENMMEFINASDYRLKVNKIESKMPLKNDIIMLKLNIANSRTKLNTIRGQLIVDMLLVTGLRVFELVAIDLDNLFLDEKLPYIMVLRKGAYVKSQMTKVYISDKIVTKIKEWLVYRSTIAKKNENALFVNRKGDRLSKLNVQQMINKYSDGKITPHMLRHYCATDLLEKTKDIAFVQEQLGHAIGSQVTMKTYVAGQEVSKKVLKNL